MSNEIKMTVAQKMHSTGKPIEYYSRWRKEWITFTGQLPDLLSMEKYHYKIRYKHPHLTTHKTNT